eukprot:gene4147-2989_t
MGASFISFNSFLLLFVCLLIVVVICGGVAEVAHILKKKEGILSLEKFLGRKVCVSVGSRDIRGILKGFDNNVNMFLTDANQYRQEVLVRSLGACVIRGGNIASVSSGDMYLLDKNPSLMKVLVAFLRANKAASCDGLCQRIEFSTETITLIRLMNVFRLLWGTGNAFKTRLAAERLTLSFTCRRFSFFKGRMSDLWLALFGEEQTDLELYACDLSQSVVQFVLLKGKENTSARISGPNRLNPAAAGRGASPHTMAGGGAAPDPAKHPAPTPPIRHGLAGARLRGASKEDPGPSPQRAPLRSPNKRPSSTLRQPPTPFPRSPKRPKTGKGAGAGAPLTVPPSNEKRNQKAPRHQPPLFFLSLPVSLDETKASICSQRVFRISSFPSAQRTIEKPGANANLREETQGRGPGILATMPNTNCPSLFKYKAACFAPAPRRFEMHGPAAKGLQCAARRNSTHTDQRLTRSTIPDRLQFTISPVILLVFVLRSLLYRKDGAKTKKEKQKEKRSNIEEKAAKKIRVFS